MSRSVVIFGQLASMTRTEAARVIKLTGGELTERLTCSTSLVIVGSRGPQFQRSGRPSIQLARVHRLLQEGCPLEVWSEEQWLRSVGLPDDAAGICKRFTAGQLAETLQIPRAKLDRWLAAGLVQPTGMSAGISLFEFQQVAAVRTLAELMQSGISLANVCRAVAKMAGWLPESSLPLAELSLSEAIGRLVIRTPDGLLAEPSGQLLLDFDADDSAMALSLPVTESDADAFRRAVQCQENSPLEAAAIYRSLIDQRGPSATLAFNLANALYAAEDLAGAMGEYQNAVELDPKHSGAWNNLANTLAELDRPESAIEAYQLALSLNPRLDDARFNLAQTLVEAGRAAEAMLQWQAYLAADSESTWAAYARERLADARV